MQEVKAIKIPQKRRVTKINQQNLEARLVGLKMWRIQVNRRTSPAALNLERLGKQSSTRVHIMLMNCTSEHAILNTGLFGGLYAL